VQYFILVPSIRLHRATASLLTHADFSQDDLQGTKVRERRLQEIEPDECREPKPVSAVIMRERKAQEDEDAGEAADDQVHFHDGIVVLVLMKTRGDQCADSGAIKCADDGVAGERACAGGAADEFESGEAQAAARHRAEEEAQDHNRAPPAAVSIWTNEYFMV
jgi:hypothetical protein